MISGQRGRVSPLPGAGLPLPPVSPWTEEGTAVGSVRDPQAGGAHWSPPQPQTLQFPRGGNGGRDNPDLTWGQWEVVHGARSPCSALAAGRPQGRQLPLRVCFLICNKGITGLLSWSPGVKTPPFHAGCVGLIPGWGSSICQEVRPKK